MYIFKIAVHTKINSFVCLREYTILEYTLTCLIYFECCRDIWIINSTQFIIKVLSIINSIIMVDCVIIWWQLSFAFSSSFWQMVSRNCHKPHINLRFLDAEKAFLLWYVWPIYFYQWDFKKIMWLFLTTMQFATWKRRRKAI